MPADRLLNTLLRSLQTYSDQQDTSRLLGTAASLLTTLNNPLNVTLLTSQILSAPAFWANPEGLRTCSRVLSVFHSVAQTIVRHEASQNGTAQDEDFSSVAHIERTLPKDDFIRACLGGADEHSPRWRHLLVIGGLLLGFGPFEDEHISRSMRVLLEKALVTAANAATWKIKEGKGEHLGPETITLVLNHAFPMLSNYQRTELDYDLLLPVLMRSTFHSVEGLRSAYFLGAIGQDVQMQADERSEWPEQSTSFQHIRRMLANPLVASLGPLSRLIGHAVESVKNSALVMAALDDLEGFARAINAQWRQQWFSQVDTAQQKALLGDDAFAVTLPALFKLLQTTMFASVIVLRSVLGRVLGDKTLASHKVAPDIAEQSLHILRSLYFITTRQGAATFSQYTFVYYTAMDILAAYHRQVRTFLLDIKPATLGRIPSHALDRNLDLFFMNTAEHFTLNLSSSMAKDLLIPAVTCYLRASEDTSLTASFEAAHSVTLAVFSAPQNSDVTIESLPIYVDLLFGAFPTRISARQFRLAFKALLKITSPPSKLAYIQPLMPAILLDLITQRTKSASTTPIPPTPGSAEAALENPIPLSEQAILVLTVLDTFTQIPLDLLDEWLPLAADLVNEVKDEEMREHCKDHFWQILVGGEMDPERSRICHAWWSTAGGKELVLYSREEEGQESAMMSGALPDGGGTGSKL